LCPTGGTSAQFWKEKEWREWSKDETTKMLEDSPWAKKWTQGQVGEVPFGQPSMGTGREVRPNLYYIVQFRSARPIREAVLRQVQLGSQFKKMSDLEKKRFEEQAEEYRSRSYDEVILIHVIYGSNVQIYERDMARFWQGFPTGTVPMSANLISSRGTKVGCVRLVSPPGSAYEFELVFPRLIGGEPWITSEDKRLRVEFLHPNVGGMRSERVFVEFNLEKMAVDGKAEY
jgi:hypothetical protein